MLHWRSKKAVVGNVLDGPFNGRTQRAEAFYGKHIGLIDTAFEWTESGRCFDDRCWDGIRNDTLHSVAICRTIVVDNMATQALCTGPLLCIYRVHQSHGGGEVWIAGDRYLVNCITIRRDLHQRGLACALRDGVQNVDLPLLFANDHRGQGVAHRQAVPIVLAYAKHRVANTDRNHLRHRIGRAAVLVAYTQYNR